MAEQQEIDAATTPHDATESIVQVLSEVLKHPTYACGGTIEYTSDIDVHWDSAGSTERLVIRHNECGPEPDALEKLLQDAIPADSAVRGKEVTDETYRKAFELDASTFCTNFSPYEAGIIDFIGQGLLPNHSTAFDWAGPARNIQWVAFYDDCEPEVLEIISGYRITLMYNLYVRRGLGELAGYTDAMNVQQLPLYQLVKAAMDEPSFMPKGGVLGKYCSHDYGHASDLGFETLPDAFKGADMMAYEVFRTLRLTTHVCPVLYIDEGMKWVLDKEEEELEIEDRVGALARIGNTLSKPEIDVYRLAESLGGTLDHYSHELWKVNWLNDPTPDTANIQFACCYSGSDVDGLYSHCALLVNILAYNKRLDLLSRL
ncbi:hypothetical protein PtrSN002B_009315 [Pyrenophora tritici-repentis]|nr:hypothetical protein PtrSN001A_009060 [Pyrenophora tritici-repentis]KAI1537755.1 hypothetical protein PtrSN002B_009315 [Pyrenophora tritici-repentis]KAI1583455.1 hypothetical protein PtrEW7m1_003297 [Pyrenophora tritici-repentis]PZC93175.1 hypothetical protein A1F95_07495 [Pyrenophora tritici-repentis]PZD42437.1 hypothetical protein A1F97_03621 [Pyrenophora tritici-repentis]